jgi:hypothetical protein
VDVVEHVVLVIDLAVEVLQADGDLLLLRVAGDLLEGLDGVLDPDIVRDAPAIAGERDDVRESGGGGGVDCFSQLGQARLVVLLVGQAVTQRVKIGRASCRERVSNNV